VLFDQSKAMLRLLDSTMSGMYESEVDWGWATRQVGLPPV